MVKHSTLIDTQQRESSPQISIAPDPRAVYTVELQRTTPWLKIVQMTII